MRNELWTDVRIPADTSKHYYGLIDDSVVGVTHAQTIVEAPVNKAASNSTTVTLNCQWNGLLAGHTVNWWSYTNPAVTGGILLSKNGNLEEGVDSSKYRIQTTSTSGQYNLQVLSLTDSEVGVYACNVGTNYYHAHVLRVGK